MSCHLARVGRLGRLLGRGTAAWLLIEPWRSLWAPIVQRPGRWAAAKAVGVPRVDRVLSAGRRPGPAGGPGPGRRSQC